MSNNVILAWLAIWLVAFVAGMTMLSIKLCQRQVKRYLKWFGPDEDDKKWEGQ